MDQLKTNGRYQHINISNCIYSKWIKIKQNWHKCYLQNAHLILWKQRMVESKMMEKCTNCNKTGVAISMSQKVDFKPRHTNWIKEGIFMIIMRCTFNKDILDNKIQEW